MHESIHLDDVVYAMPYTCMGFLFFFFCLLSEDLVIQIYI
jgi:hypothetical protein